MTFDFKKQFKELYRPGTKPSIVNVPEINFLAEYLLYACLTLFHPQM